jgi:hypothetical protein
MIDQVDNSTVAATDIVTFTATHPMRLPLTLDKSEWWEPANQAARNFSPDRFLDASCHQDKSGCRPDSVNLNGIEPQSWHGELATQGPGLVQADLRFEHRPDNSTHLLGKLTNLSTTAMTDIHILTASRNFLVLLPLAAGATINLDQLPESDPILFSGLPADVNDISPKRADRVDELVKSGRAEVICQMPDAVDVKVGPVAQAHWQILRAVLVMSK